MLIKSKIIEFSFIMSYLGELGSCWSFLIFPHSLEGIKSVESAIDDSTVIIDVTSFIGHPLNEF